MFSPPFDKSLWTDLVTKLVFNLQSSGRMNHYRLARNTGLQIDYLLEKSFETNGALRVENVECVYPNIVFDGFGQVKAIPIHCLAPSALPKKMLKCSPFHPSGMIGFLKMLLPPFTSSSVERRGTQIVAVMGTLVESFYKLIIHEIGSCPGLLLASVEPETHKSTLAKKRLKWRGILFKMPFVTKWCVK